MINKLISSIPEDFKQRQINMSKESSLVWFDKLPEIIKNVVEKWELSDYCLVEEMTFNNILFYAQSSEFGKVVVKIGHPAYELFFNEPAALNYYKGQYACKIYDLDSKNLAMLLERLSPGKQLSEINDMKERIKIASNLLVKINKTLEDESKFSNYEEMIPDYFQRVRTKIEEKSQLFNLINIAEKLFYEILSERYIRVLTHGDYHYRNILQSDKKFKVIDPKGIVGFGFMDTAKLIKNELYISNNRLNMSYLDQVTSLISRYTGYSVKLLSKWLFIESVFRVAGNILYIKSDKKELAKKIKRSNFYLEYYEQN